MCNELLHIIIKHETCIVYCNLKWLVIGHCRGSNSNHLDRRCLFPSSSLLRNSVQWDGWCWRLNLFSIKATLHEVMQCLTFICTCVIMTHLYQYLYFHNHARHSRFLQLHLIQCFCLRYILHSGSVYTQNAISFHYLHLNWCSSIQCMHHTLVYHVRCAMTECLVDQFSWILNFPLLLLLSMIPDVCSWILSSDWSPESERLAAQHSFAGIWT